MKAQATCFGAGTIVNAIATGKGAAFGLALRATAMAVATPNANSVLVRSSTGIDPALVAGCAKRVLRRSRRKVGLEVMIDSEIPVSRGLKSSSAVANAAVLASARALDVRLEPLQIVNIGVDAALEAHVTITGAFDDACASFFGGIVVTDNKSRKLEKTDRFRPDLMAVLHIPRRIITKASLAAIDFSSIRTKVDEAYRLALRADYLHALEANSAAYAPILGIDETPARRARAAGAVAAGVSGAGPAIIALVRPAHVDTVVRALEDGESEVRVASLNTTESREVIA